MVVTTNTATKRKRVSKKTKRSWRKHVDIKDVEEFLNEKRLDERLGPKFETLTDDQLFKIDKKPIQTRLTKVQKRKLLAETIPKCFSILQPFTKVSDPISKRNVKTSLKESQSIVVKLGKKRRERIQSAKKELAEKSRAINKAKKLTEKRKFERARKDLWIEEESDLSNKLKNEWIKGDTVRHHYQGLGKLRKIPPISLNEKKSLHPTIETPHPGTSYNPTLKAHQQLLQEVTKKESDLIKRNKRIHRQTTQMFDKLTPVQATTRWIEEMSQGLPQPNQKEPESGTDSDSEYKAINPPVKNKKKDLKTRRKRREHNKQEQEKRVMKLEKKKHIDIQKVKVLNKQIDKQESTLKRKEDARNKIKEELKFEPKRLGAIKYEAPDPVFNMPEDIAGNLLNIKTEGSLLYDRFKSLQKRNILPPSVRQFRPKGKYKVYEKATHKMGWEPKGY